MSHSYVIKLGLHRDDERFGFTQEWQGRGPRTLCRLTLYSAGASVRLLLWAKELRGLVDAIRVHKKHQINPHIAEDKVPRVLTLVPLSIGDLEVREGDEHLLTVPLKMAQRIQAHPPKLSGARPVRARAA